MPAALAPALVAIGMSATVASVASYGIFTVALIGVQYLLNRLTQKKAKPETQINQFTIRQAVPVRVRGYGRNKMAGALFTEHAIPTANLWMGLVHCEGPVDEVEEWWLNDTNTGIAAGSIIAQNHAIPWVFYIGIETHRGDIPEAAIAALSGGGTYKLDGLCTSVVVCTMPFQPQKNFQYYYPNGAPVLRIVARCVRVFDPRISLDWNNGAAWRWSQNPALCILDYLTFGLTDRDGKFIRRGMGLPRTTMNLQSFIDFADVCDEDMPTIYPNESPTPTVVTMEPRYQLDGMYSMDELPSEVLARMLATCDGELYTLSDGTVGIRGGKWTEPTVTITEDMILSFRLTQGSEKLAAFNRLAISYTCEQLDYQVVHATPYDDELNQIINGVLPQSLELPFVHSYTQVRRLAKIHMRKSNPQWRYESMVCNLKALNAIDQQFVNVNHPTLGINESFCIIGFKLDPSNMVCILSLISLDDSTYAWNAEVEDRAPPNASGTVVVDTDRPGIVQAWAQGGNLNMGLTSDTSLAHDDFSLASTTLIHTDLGLESA